MRKHANRTEVDTVSLPGHGPTTAPTRRDTPLQVTHHFRAHLGGDPGVRPAGGSGCLLLDW